MADTKISALSAASALTGAEEFAVNQGGVSKKATATQVKTFAIELNGETITGVTLAGADITGTSTITGATVQTAASDNRIVMDQDASAGVLKFHIDDGYGADPGYLNSEYDNVRTQPGITLLTPRMPAGQAARIVMWGSEADGTSGSIVLDPGGGLGAKVIVLGPLDAALFATGGNVGTGDFRDSVDARANAMSAARMQAGTASSGTVVAATAKTVTVTFPTAFSSAPKVTLTGISSDPGVDRRVSVVPGSETATQFQVAFWRATGTASFDTNWLAVKP